jgi:fatty acid desaturase
MGKGAGKGAGKGGKDTPQERSADGTPLGVTRVVPIKAADGGPYQGPFPPLKEAAEPLKSIRWYRCPMQKGALGELMKRSDAKGLWQCGGHFSIFLATALCVHRCCTAGAYMALPFAMFAHGTVGSTLVYGCHELGHGTMFQTKALNTFFLYLYSVLFWWDPIDYAASHTYHHRYSQYPEADRENLFPLEPTLDKWVMLRLFTVNLDSGPGRVFGKGGMFSTIKLTCKAALGGVASEEGAESYEWLQKVHEDQPEEWTRSMHFSQGIVAFHLAVLCYSLATAQPILIFIVSLHSFFCSWYSYFVGSCQHCGLKSSTPDFRKNTRSITLDPFSEFLFFHMNWHIEHHMFAAVPCYNLKKCHEATQDYMPEPRSLVGAWTEMREIWHRQQLDPTYEFDTPVRDGGKAAGGLVTDEIGGSIGDLAPAGLTDAKKDA